jgi:hypothetical protein
MSAHPDDHLPTYSLFTQSRQTRTHTILPTLRVLDLAMGFSAHSSGNPHGCGPRRTLPTLQLYLPEEWVDLSMDIFFTHPSAGLSGLWHRRVFHPLFRQSPQDDGWIHMGSDPCLDNFQRLLSTVRAHPLDTSGDVGLVSAGRTDKGTPPLTTPGHSSKSSAMDVSPHIF